MQASTNVPEASLHAVARLTKAQKRDLFGMGAAAVLTTALIAAPAVLPLVESAHQDQELADAAHDAPVVSVANVPAAQPVALPTAAAGAQPVTIARVEVVPASIQRRAAPAQRRLRSTPLPPAIRTIALPSPAVASGPEPAILVATAAVDRPSRPLARKLAGFLTGDGTYSVRPFPTVSANRH